MNVRMVISIAITGSPTCFRRPMVFPAAIYRHAIHHGAAMESPRSAYIPPGFDTVSEHPGEFWDGVARLDERGEGPIFLFRPAACGASVFPITHPLGRARGALSS